MRVLVVNAGSSTLKLSVIEADGERTFSQTLEGVADADDAALAEFLGRIGDVDAVGHRVVHGGARFVAPTRVDDEMLAYLDSLTDLAPLHNARSASGIRLLARLRPDLPAVATFDTSFHSTLTPAARTYALPRAWNERHGLRRYGFHGLSHSHAARAGPAIAGVTATPVSNTRVVSCHLGSGASVAAIVGGRSVDTTMGFTPLAGLVMQTRVGSVDPGLLLWLLDSGSVGMPEMVHALSHDAGLKGLSGTSGDMREVLAARAGGHADAVLAFDVFVQQLVREIGAMAASAGGLDVLVFTGGVGEHVPEVRTAAAASLGFLGVRLDEDRNRAASADADITADGAAVRTVVVTAAEDLEIARQTRDALRPGDRG
ncbi:acetate/propionate family kinase [Nocardioides limicola]|uniref:acetate/propionate family kinase n=1 Tax=Nocardioides limicola TaxID=2803368 RepID=UPI001EEFAA1D|nr:acetate/propionate family kinase [Nocardioides sp. DJM-14]